MTPPAASRAVGTVLRFLAAALMLGGIASVLRLRAADPPDVGAEAYGPPPGDRCQPVSACGPQLLQDLPGAPTLGFAEACRGAGYLCDGLAVRSGPMRALRWADDVASIRVQLRWPDNADEQQAGRLQRGAARGLRAWDGRPLRIVVDADRAPVGERTASGTGAQPVVRRGYRPPPRRVTGGTGLIRPTANAPDFQVQWNVTPRSEERGEVYTSWGPDAARSGYGIEVISMWLPMMTEWPGGRDLTDREVEAAAAHAMGHALGLPHSASPADVMYPGNTATAPSQDDLAALAALYALPNGARITEEDGR